jgi:hypothetical protein
MIYEVVLLRVGEEIQSIYWTGSLQETVNLARTIAFSCEADRFRIIELADSGTEVRLEEAVSLTSGSEFRTAVGSSASRWHARSDNSALLQ